MKLSIFKTRRASITSIAVGVGMLIMCAVFVPFMSLQMAILTGTVGLLGAIAYITAGIHSLGAQKTDKQEAEQVAIKKEEFLPFTVARDAVLTALEAFELDDGDHRRLFGPAGATIFLQRIDLGYRMYGVNRSQPLYEGDVAMLKETFFTVTPRTELVFCHPTVKRADDFKSPRMDKELRASLPEGALTASESELYELAHQLLTWEEEGEVTTPGRPGC